MNCREMKKYLYSFVDNELDVERNLEVLEHLNMCPSCEGHAEEAGSLRERIACFGHAMAVPDGLEGRLRGMLQREAGRRYSMRRRWLRLIAAAAVVVITMTAGVWMRTLPSPWVDVIASVHETHLAHGNEPAITDCTADQMVRQLDRHLSRRPMVPEFSDDDSIELIGASECYTKYGPVGLVSYRKDKVPVSLVILPDNGRFSSRGMKKVLAQSELYEGVCSSCGRCHVVLYAYDNFIYAFVSCLPAQELAGMFDGFEGLPRAT